MPLRLNLSTCCRSTGACDGRGLIDMLAGFDIQGLELEYRIPEEILPEMEAALIDHRMPVASIHNFFPIPDTMPRHKGSDDLYPLMSPDPEMRRQAVNGTKRTIRYAEMFGAKAIVLHCGAIPMHTELDRLYRYYRKGKIATSQARTFMEDKRVALREQKGPYLEALKRSLDLLIPSADAAGIRLGLENRFHHHELPGSTDFSTLFGKFRGSPVGYWHDVGHAHAQEALGVIPRGALLKAHGDMLIGIHLHDAVGVEDHLPPGTGEIDLGLLQGYIRPDTLLMLELQPGTPDGAIERGIAHIRKVFATGNA